MKRDRAPPGKPPLSPGFKLESRTTTFFEKADLEKLVVDGFPPLSALHTPDSLAASLDWAFCGALSADVLNRQTPTGKEVTEYLTKVTASAGRLLEELDMPQEMSRYETEGAISIQCRDWFQHVEAGLYRSTIHFSPKADYLRPNVNALRKERFARERERASLGIHDVSDGRMEFPEIGRWLLTILPVALATLVRAAEEAPAATKERSREALFRRALYQNLAAAHEAMFGLKPKVRDNNNERDGWSVEWITLVLKHAANRANQHMTELGLTRDEANAIDNIHRHAYETKSEYLAQGWRDHLEQVRRLGKGSGHEQPKAPA